LQRVASVIIIQDRFSMADEVGCSVFR